MCVWARSAKPKQHPCWTVEPCCTFNVPLEGVLICVILHATAIHRERSWRTQSMLSSRDGWPSAVLVPLGVLMPTCAQPQHPFLGWGWWICVHIQPQADAADVRTVGKQTVAGDVGCCARPLRFSCRRPSDHERKEGCCRRSCFAADSSGSAICWVSSILSFFLSFFCTGARHIGPGLLHQTTTRNAATYLL